jgi:hypothetical protein
MTARQQHRYTQDRNEETGWIYNSLSYLSLNSRRSSLLQRLPLFLDDSDKVTGGMAVLVGSAAPFAELSSTAHPHRFGEVMPARRKREGPVTGPTTHIAPRPNATVDHTRPVLLPRLYRCVNMDRAAPQHLPLPSLLRALP